MSSKTLEDTTSTTEEPTEGPKDLVASSGGDGRSSKLQQLLVVFSVCMGGASFGYSNAWMSIASPSLSDCEDNPSKPDGCTFDEEFTENQTSWIGSLYFVGMVASVPVMGWFMASVGRRASLFVMAIPILAGDLILALSEPLNLDQAYWFYVGRLLIGIGGGYLGIALVVYIHECVEADIRGSLGNLPFFFSISTYFLGTLVGAMVPWYTMTQIGLIFPVLQISILFFVPETPFAYVLKNETAKARKSLLRLRGKNFNADAEIERLQEALDEVMQEGKVGLRGVLTKAVYLKPLLIMLFMGFLCQFTGISGVSLYLTEIFIKAGFDEDKSLYYSAAVASAQVFGVATAVLLVDHIGRIFLLVVGSFGCLVSMTALGTYFYLDDHIEVICANGTAPVTTVDPCIPHDGFTLETLDSLSWLPLASLFTFKFSHAMSLSIIPFMMYGEFFSAEAKDVSSTLGQMFSNLCGFLLGQFQASMEALMGTAGLYYFYGGVAAASVLFCAFFLPETKGKSAKEMKRIFNRKEETSRS